MVSVANVKSVDISGEAIERSGEEGVPFEGSLVGVSVLSVTRLDEVRRSLMMSPRTSAR